MQPRNESLAHEQFMAVLNGIEEAIYVADTTTYEVLFVNRVCREQLGKDAVGTICYRTFQGREAPCPFCTNDIILRQAPATYRWEHHNPVTGRIYDLHDRIIQWPDGRAVRLELAIDITNRKRAEAALQESRDLYDLVARGAAGGVWDWDVASHRVRLSSRWKSMRGYADNDIGDSETEWSTRIHPDDAARVMAALAAHFSGQTVRFEEEYRSQRKDGSYMWVRDCGMARRDAAGKVIRMAGSEIDITERKREHELLSQQLQLVQAILETTPGFLVLKDRDSVYREVNPAFCRFLGKPRDAIVGKTDGELFPPDEAAAYRAGDVTVMETGTVESRDWLVTGAKGKLWLHVTKSPVRDTYGDITGVLCSVLDVTERKQVEESLRQSEARHRAVMDTMLHGLVHQSSNSTIIAMNPAAEHILGRTAAELMNRSSMQEEYQTVHEDGSPFLETEHPSVVSLRTGRPVRGAIMGVWNPQRQERRWIEIDAVPVFAPGQDSPAEVFALFADITERRRSEAKLERMHSILLEAQKIAHLGSFEHLVATQGTVWSEEEYRIYGLNPAQPSPTYAVMLAKCIHPDDAALLHETITKAIQCRSAYELEHRIVRPDGSVRWVYNLAHPYFDQQGELVRYLGTTQDITERKQAAAALIKSEDRFRSLVEQAPEGIFIQTRQRFAYVNASMVRLLGADGPEQLLGDLVESHVHPDFRRLVRERIHQLNEKRLPQPPADQIFLRKDGSFCNVSVSGVPFEFNGDKGALVFVRDITERKQAEIALSENSLMLAQSQQIGHVGSWRLASPSNRLTWSGETYRIFGCEPHEFVPTYEAFLGFVHPDDRAAVHNAYTSSIANRRDSYAFEYRIVRRATGEIRHLREECVHSRDAAGTIVQSVGTVQDITAKARATMYLLAGTSILSLLSSIRTQPLRDVVQQIVHILKTHTALDAVGFRIADGEDFPYFASVGFSAKFLREEASVVAHHPDGKIYRNPDGSVYLECTCGLVLSGLTDPANPLFTARGSYVANNSSRPARPPPSPDPRIHPRDCCVHQGYASVALIPIREDKKALGLLHLASHAPESFPPDVVDILENLASSIGASMARLQAEEMRELQAQELRNSERRFRTLFENHSAVMLLIDPRTGAILDANPAAASYYGWTREQLRSMQISDINTMGKACEREMRKSADGAQNYFEFRHRRADGSVRDVSVFSSSIVDGTRTLLHSVIHDITERNQMVAVQSFLASGCVELSAESFFTSLAQFLAEILSADFVFISRYRQGGLLLSCLAAWPSAGLDSAGERHILDTPCSAVLSKGFGIFASGVCDLFPHAAFLRGLGAEGYAGINLSDHNGTPIGIIAAITKRPMQDTALAEHIMRAVAVRAASELERMGAEIKLREKVQALAMANEELKHAESRLVMQEKLASVGRLAAGVAHEINNPIGFLMNNFTALREDVAVFRNLLDGYGGLCAKASRHPDLAGDVARLKAQADAAKLTFVQQDVEALFRESEDGFQRTLQILSSMRNFARDGAAESKSPYNLNDSIRSTLIIARNEYKYHCDIITELGNIPQIQCEPGKINQVILNLLVNAAQAIGGQQRQTKGHITIRTRVDGDRVCCEIADDGPGIPAAIIDRVFEPFFTTKPPGSGTGLGLSISYDIIVNQHGGTLTVDSKEGCGATFLFSLPRRKQTTAAQGELNP